MITKMIFWIAPRNESFPVISHVGHKFARHPASYSVILFIGATHIRACFANEEKTSLWNSESPVGVERKTDCRVQKRIDDSSQFARTLKGQKS